MDLDHLRSCSYNQLKEIAMTHDVYKTAKTKKKAVLLEKILDYFSKNPECNSHFDSERKENIAELLNVEEQEKTSVAVKKDNKRNRRNPNFNDSPARSFEKISLESSDDRRGTFVVSEGKDNKVLQEMSVSSGPNKKGRKGKRVKSKDTVKDESSDNSEENQGSADVSNKQETCAVTENDDLTTAEALSSSQEGNKKGRRGKRTKSKDVVKDESCDNSEENKKSTDKASRRGPTVTSDNEDVTSLQQISGSPESKDIKGRKGKKPRSKNEIKIDVSNSADERIDLTDVADRRGTFVVSEEMGVTSLQEVFTSEKASSRSQRGLRTKTKNGSIDTCKPDVTEVSEKQEGSVSERISESTQTSKGRRGKRTKSKDLVKNEVNDQKSSSDENNDPGPSEARTKSRRGKKPESKDVNNYNNDENPELNVEADTGTFVMSEAKDTAALQETSGSDDSSSKGRRGKRTKSKDVIKEETSDNSLSDASNRTFVVSETEGASSPESRSKRRRRNNSNSKNNVENKIVNTEEDHDVADDNGDRRGTFVVSEAKDLATLQKVTGTERSCNKGRKGKITKSKDVIKVDSSDNSLPDKKVDTTETLVSSMKSKGSSLEVTTGSPALRGKRLRSQGETGIKDEIHKSPAPKMLKVSNMKPASRLGAALNKTVTIVTPKRSPFTPKRNETASGAASNRSFTFSPHPAKLQQQNSSASKGSASFIFSDKKNPGQFSAKKMPNFAKAHSELFGKMESLKSYSERKKARMEIFSPLNKTLPSLSSLEQKVAKKSESNSGPVAKSLIPVKSTSSIRLSNKEKINTFANKTHVPNVKAIREREKEIIKGVRANKRFILQMKMRNIE